MRELLPEPVVTAIQRHYERAISAAQEGYNSSREDEDSVTGALGQAMRRINGRVTVDGVVYRWRTTYRKFRGRGYKAAEKLFGADGIFEIEVFDDDGNTLGRKALLFQAKNNWRGRDERLTRQASQLSGVRGAAIVVNYGSEGYTAVSAEIVAEAEGNRSRLPPEAESPLSDVIARKFVLCSIGRRDLYYDAERKLLVYLSEGQIILARRLPVRHRVRTTVGMRSRPRDR